MATTVSSPSTRANSAEPVLAHKTCPKLQTICEVGAELCGKWATLNERSDAFEPLLKALGTPWLKRKVMNSAAFTLNIGFAAIVDPEDPPVLNITVQLPVGKKVMKWQLDGKPFSVKDSDCGDWIAVCTTEETTHGVALLQTRTSETHGKVVEVRQVISDVKYGKVMLITYTLCQQGKPNIVVNRYLRPE